PFKTLTWSNLMSRPINRTPRLRYRHVRFGLSTVAGDETVHRNRDGTVAVQIIRPITGTLIARKILIRYGVIRNRASTPRSSRRIQIQDRIRDGCRAERRAITSRGFLPFQPLPPQKGGMIS